MTLKKGKKYEGRRTKGAFKEAYMANRLLTISGIFSDIQQTFVGFFNNFGVLYALEILVLFGMIFFVSKVLRDNDSTKLMLL